MYMWNGHMYEVWEAEHGICRKQASRHADTHRLVCSPGSRVSFALYIPCETRLQRELSPSHSFAASLHITTRTHWHARRNMRNDTRDNNVVFPFQFLGARGFRKFGATC